MLIVPIPPCFHFNPRSREGSDGFPPQKFENLSVDFNPRSREGSDLVSKTNFFLPEKFQSTLPRRERQQPNPIIVFIEDFNPRSREGSDLLIKYSVLNSMDFNPRSREGSDLPPPSSRWLLPGFQSTLPRRERLISSWILAAAFSFQSTLPRRERPRKKALSRCATWNFNPRSREGSDIPHFWHFLP